MSSLHGCLWLDRWKSKFSFSSLNYNCPLFGEIFRIFLSVALISCLLLTLCVWIFRCEEPLSSPGVSKSISEGIIEEEEEEEEEGGESNHKRKKEDDQEVMHISNIKIRKVSFGFHFHHFFHLELQIKKESLYTWRIELSKTEKYWEGWFKGLSSLFLTCSVPKLLLLAGK